MIGLNHIPKAFNGRLLFSCLLIALAQVNFGMDQAAFGSTQAMIPFEEKFGIYDETTKAYIIEPKFLSYLNSFPYMGFAFGLVQGSFVSSKFGRRIAIFVMCVWSVVGATILITSNSRPQILTGRIIAYVYNGMALGVVPVLQSELVPGNVRGFVVGTFQLGLSLGQLIMACICRGTSDLTDDSSWRIPFGLFYVIPVIVGTLVWFIPESPRWLLMKHHPDRSLEALRKLRRGVFSEEDIENEFQALRSTIDLTVENGRFYEIFQGTNLKRTLIVVGTNLLLQLTGQNFATVYGTLFFQSLGTVNPFSMTATMYGVNIVTAMICMSLVDRTGRIPLMMIGALIQTGSLFTMGGLGTKADPSFGEKSGIIAMVLIFSASFNVGWAPLAHVVAAEVPTLRLRDPTYGLGAFGNLVIQFAVSFSTPYLLYAPYANLGSKVGFIFGSLAFVALLFSYFCIPECSGKSLEEIDQLFLEKTPIRKFKNATSRLSDPGDKSVGQKDSAAVDVEEI